MAADFDRIRNKGLDSVAVSSHDIAVRFRDAFEGGVDPENERVIQAAGSLQHRPPTR